MPTASASWEIDGGGIGGSELVAVKPPPSRRHRRCGFGLRRLRRQRSVLCANYHITDDRPLVLLPPPLRVGSTCCGTVALGDDDSEDDVGEDERDDESVGADVVAAVDVDEDESIEEDEVHDPPPSSPDDVAPAVDDGVGDDDKPSTPPLTTMALVVLPVLLMVLFSSDTSPPTGVVTVVDVRPTPSSSSSSSSALSLSLSLWSTCASANTFASVSCCSCSCSCCCLLSWSIVSGKICTLSNGAGAVLCVTNTATLVRSALGNVTRNEGFRRQLLIAWCCVRRSGGVGGGGGGGIAVRDLRRRRPIIQGDLLIGGNFFALGAMLFGGHVVSGCALGQQCVVRRFQQPAVCRNECHRPAIVVVIVGVVGFGSRDRCRAFRRRSLVALLLPQRTTSTVTTTTDILVVVFAFNPHFIHRPPYYTLLLFGFAVDSLVDTLPPPPPSQT
uniref:Uncharacterized protein n=1 Tax=Anopheles atroparvus TaxID=41427 RepID=A0A182J2H2_ANOAO